MHHCHQCKDYRCNGYSISIWYTRVASKKKQIPNDIMSYSLCRSLDITNLFKVLTAQCTWRFPILFWKFEIYEIAFL